MQLRLRLYIYLLILIGIGVYFNSLTNSFIGDDFDQIVNNTDILHPKNIWHFFTGSTFYGGGGERLSGLHFRPLMLFSYSIIYTLFGLKPIFFHLLQLIFHIANTLLLFFLFRSFFKNTLAFFLALLFLIHPINNETVVYIANLQDTLFLFFGLAGTLLIQKGKIKSTLQGGLVLTTLMLLSLFSKETGILFAVIYFLQAYILNKIPVKFVIITSSIAIGIYLLTRFYIADVYLPTEAIAPLYNAPLTTRLLTLPQIFFYYIKMFFFPLHISTFHFFMVDKPTLVNYILPLFSIIVTLGAILLFGRKVREVKEKFQLFLFFVIWLMIGMLAHAQLIPLEMTVADRWFYFSSIGTFGLLGLTIESLKLNKKRTNIVIIACIVVFLLLGSRTFIRNYDWKDPITLYEHDTKVDTQNFFLENSLGAEYLIKGEYKKAKSHIEKSLALNPYFGNLNNMAVIANKAGDMKKAREYLERAILIDNNYIVTENYAKFLYANEKNTEKTITFIQNALKQYPNNATLYMYLGLTEEKSGDHQKAIEYTKKAYDLNPNELTTDTYGRIKKEGSK